MGTTARRVGSAPTVHRLALTQARGNLGAVVERARLHKEYVVLEKDGVPVAGLMDIDEFEDYLELQDPKVRAVIARGRQAYRAGKSRPARELLTRLQARHGGKTARRQPA